MKAIRIGILVLAIMVWVIEAAAQRPAAPRSPPPPPPATTAPPATSASQTPEMTLKDIERTLGFVPQFMRAIPDELLPGFWQSMKEFELSPRTRLDAKTKELIGLAVASQIPCEYCVRFHTEIAKLNGATQQEIQEAVGMGAMTRFGSTLLNGLQIDPAQFRRDLDRIVRTSRQQAARNNRRAPRRPSAPSRPAGASR